MQSNKWQVTAFLGMLLTAATGFGQSARVVKVDIPFPFVVASQTLPAGNYELSLDGQVVRIANSNKQAAAVVSIDADNRNPERPPRLIFHRYGDTYFLSQVMPTDSMGKELYMSRAGQEMEGKGIR